MTNQGTGNYYSTAAPFNSTVRFSVFQLIALVLLPATFGSLLSSTSFLSSKPHCTLPAQHQMADRQSKQPAGERSGVCSS